MTVATNRSAALDLLRALAIGRVLAFHLTDITALTLIPAMSVMFWISGTLAVPALDRSGAYEFWSRRMRRVLVPLFPYALVVVVIVSVAGALGELGWYRTMTTFLPFLSPHPEGLVQHGRSGWFVGIEGLWTHLWYLQTYVLFLFILILGVGRARSEAARRRILIGMSIGCVVVAVILDIVALAVGESATLWCGRLGGFLVQLAVFVGGAIWGQAAIFAPNRWSIPNWAVGAAVGAAGISQALVGTTLTSTTLALRSLALLMVCGRFLAVLERWGNSIAVSRLLGWLSTRLVSLYLWQMLGIYAALQVLERLLPDVHGPSAAALRVVLGLAFTLVAVTVVQPFELWAKTARLHNRTARGGAQTHHGEHL